MNEVTSVKSTIRDNQLEELGKAYKKAYKAYHFVEKSQINKRLLGLESRKIFDFCRQNQINWREKEDEFKQEAFKEFKLDLEVKYIDAGKNYLGNKTLETKRLRNYALNNMGQFFQLIGIGRNQITQRIEYLNVRTREEKRLEDIYKRNFKILSVAHGEKEYIVGERRNLDNARKTLELFFRGINIQLDENYFKNLQEMAIKEIEDAKEKRSENILKDSLFKFQVHMYKLERTHEKEEEKRRGKREKFKSKKLYDAEKRRRQREKIKSKKMFDAEKTEIEKIGFEEIRRIKQQGDRVNLEIVRSRMQKRAIKSANPLKKKYEKLAKLKQEVHTAKGDLFSRGRGYQRQAIEPPPQRLPTFEDVGFRNDDPSSTRKWEEGI